MFSQKPIILCHSKFWMCDLWNVWILVLETTKIYCPAETFCLTSHTIKFPATPFLWGSYELNVSDLVNLHPRLCCIMQMMLGSCYVEWVPRMFWQQWRQSIARLQSSLTEFKVKCSVCRPLDWYVSCQIDGQESTALQQHN